MRKGRITIRKIYSIMDDYNIHVSKVFLVNEHTTRVYARMACHTHLVLALLLTQYNNPTSALESNVPVSRISISCSRAWLASSTHCMLLSRFVYALTFFYKKKHSYRCIFGFHACIDDRSRVSPWIVHVNATRALSILQGTCMSMPKEISLDPDGGQI